jgi:hypothetical protein
VNAGVLVTPRRGDQGRSLHLRLNLHPNRERKRMDRLPDSADAVTDDVLIIDKRKRWIFSGGDEDADSITLFVSVPESLTGHEIRVAVAVSDDGDLIVGMPMVTSRSVADRS